MAEVNFHRLLLGAVAEQELHGVDVDAVRSAIVRALLAVLTPEQLADVVVSRVRIERAKGFLMQVYESTPIVPSTF